MSKVTSKESVDIVEFKDALGERYLSYALSTIMSRSLPDVRDGLKPVHRRLLYAMLQLKLDPKSGFKKCARVVGDVIGKFHPHGDVAVYDTMVRLAQDFSVRFPLVEGQGNFGSIDGDNPAAMRYTEARLTEVALALLADIDKDTVDFRPTYDGSEFEPLILPARFPNLLANGAEGIAVGMATSIPPHNIDELCEALSHLIKYPNSGMDKLLGYVKGPDFPTGGVIVEPEANIKFAYENGKGSFRLRARWEKEELSHGMYQVIVTEIPYQVQKSKLIEEIAEVFKAKKVPLLGNIRDESAEEIRIVLEPKNRSVSPEILMESLFKTTDLENRISLNMNVLDQHSSPRVMNLKEVLQAFIEHRLDVLVRKSKFRLKQIDNRLEILEGLLIAYLNLDEVIKIIRERDDAKDYMMKKWKLTENQVEAILNMRLRSLRKLEEIEIKSEHKTLSTEKKELKALLVDEEKRRQYVADEIKDIKEKFGKKTKLGKRKTSFSEVSASAADVSIEAFVEKEPITIILSKMGWVRAVKGHAYNIDELKFKEGDEGRFFITGYTTDKMIVFSGDGRFFTINCNNISRGKGDGDNIRLMIDLDTSEICSVFIYKDDAKLLVASNSGKGFIVEAKDVLASTRSGKQVMNVEAGASALSAQIVDGEMVATIGTNRKLLIFKSEEIPLMKKGQGVILQKFSGAELSDIKTFKLSEGLNFSTGRQNRLEKNVIEWLGKRAAAGKLPPHGFSRKNIFHE